MGIRSWEWEGMESERSFLHISTAEVIFEINNIMRGRLSAHHLSLHNRAGEAGSRNALTSHRLKYKNASKNSAFILLFITNNNDERSIHIEKIMDRPWFLEEMEKALKKSGLLIAISRKVLHWLANL